jgi:uncharacterized protein (TIGR03084 family)
MRARHGALRADYEVGKVEMTLQVSIDFRDEVAELYTFLKTLAPEDWETQTLFMDWTPWDVVAHLHYFDEVSLHAAEGEEAFAARRKALIDSVGTGMTSKAIARRDLGRYGASALLERWKSTSDQLSAKLGELDPKSRLPWFGPDMGTQMFTTARYMETWAHAQEIYDLKKVRRKHTDRIGNIAAIGVRTYGWTFVNRKRTVPGPPPYVRLRSSSGETWEYNEPSVDERVEGSAVDFCLTVTQVRNVADTGLVVVGDTANQWMAIAQCFAGSPVDPPKPGRRLGA